MKISSPPPWPCGRSRRTVVKFWMRGLHDLDSCIAATFTLCFSRKRSNSDSLLPIPFALNVPSLGLLVVVGAGGGCVGGGAGAELQVLRAQSFVLLYCNSTFICLNYFTFLKVVFGSHFYQKPNDDSCLSCHSFNCCILIEHYLTVN